MTMKRLCLGLFVLAIVSIAPLSGFAQSRLPDTAGVRPDERAVAVISFTGKPEYPAVGQPVQFSVTGGSGVNGVISWKWDFGDGKSSSLRNPRHAFSKPGFYSVSLMSITSSGLLRARRTISVRPRTVASFTYSPGSPKVGQTVQFTDATTAGPTSWQWDFGDGATSTVQHATHKYKGPGSYTVTLVAGVSSSRDTARKTLKVVAATPKSPLLASFTHNPGSPAPGQAVQFTDTSAGSPTAWHWDFNDGETSTAQNPAHAFAAAGNHNVTLTVTNSSGSNSASQSIVVGSEATGKTGSSSEEIRAASPSLEDVKAAIAKAKAGDTVTVPAGKATWNSQLVITKGIHLIGAGIGNTVITGSYSAPGKYPYLSVSGYLIVYNPSNPELDEPFRLSGFSFDCSGSSCGLMLRNATATAITKVRVDHNRIENCHRSRPMYVKGTVFGVADNNEFVGAYMSIDGLDSKTWNNIAFRFGTANMFYFEDNTFTATSGSLCMRSEMGAIWCARYNHWDATNDPNGLYPLFDMHGNQPGAHNAAMGVEVYGNTVTEPGHGACLMDQRGGMALVYDNNVISRGSVGTKVREEFVDSLNAPINSPITGQPQHVSRSYYWGNRKNDKVPVYPYVSRTVDYGGDKGAVPQKNREFWSENPLFDGTKDLGVGPLANRPNTCAIGVGYWATDTKTLYVCTSADVWEAYYTPYTYPHPLRTLLSN
jgi:PKD repeat protein